MNSQSKLLERITDLEREVKLLTLEIRRVRLENKKQLTVAIAEKDIADTRDYLTKQNNLDIKE